VALDGAGAIRRRAGDPRRGHAGVPRRHQADVGHATATRRVRRAVTGRHPPGPPPAVNVRAAGTGRRRTDPDAHIESSAGLIPIDSKFPLENYERHVQAEDADEGARYRRKFASDVERQLRTIADDYVQPSEGTTDFAFAFIPSESVYYHLVREEYDLLRGDTKQGVQVVSPLTLGHKLELIKADVQAQQLSEQAEAVLEELEVLGERFDEVIDEWDTLYRHLRNAKNKADDAHDRLRAEFDRIDQPSLEGGDARSGGD